MATKQLLFTISTLSIALLLATARTVQTAFETGVRCKCMTLLGCTNVLDNLNISSNASANRASASSEAAFKYPISTSADRALPMPNQVMVRYIEQHSVEALRQDPHPERRKYAIAFYQCPLQAGNRLHHFWNNVLWSILTNRTVLYKYWDEETCITYGTQAHTAICRAANAADDCARVLHRAPWMASFDEWKHVVLEEADEEPFMVPYHATMGRVREDPRFPLPPNYERDYGVDLASKYPHRVLIFPICYFKFRQLGNAELQRTLLKTQWARDKVRELFIFGEDYLYGMLHRYTFDFADDIRKAVPASATNMFTIGLHSRHRFAGLDGCNIDREISCLHKVIARRDDKTKPVSVSIMSDRACTISKLTAWLQVNNHSFIIAEHNEITSDGKDEHGPFAGVGFYQDLAVVSSARSAIVAMKRSSSDLLRELMVFNQAMDAWESHGNMSKRIDSCVLPYQADPAALANESGVLATPSMARVDGTTKPGHGP